MAEAGCAFCAQVARALLRTGGEGRTGHSVLQELPVGSERGEVEIFGEGRLVRILVPCYGEEVAPAFGSARSFRLYEVEDRAVISCRELRVEAEGELERVRLIWKVSGDVLICNGIETTLRQMLEASDCRVFAGVVGLASEATFGLLAGRLRCREEGCPLALELEKVQQHTADLVEWTEDLLRSSGWTVRRVPQPVAAPVDLAIERGCPACGKTVRVAVCCGAHAFGVEEEIRELRRVAASSYDAWIYVQHAFPVVASTCREYGISLLDPTAFGDEGRDTGWPLYPLQVEVPGHEGLEAPEKR